jgi:hypothetical protein
VKIAYHASLFCGHQSGGWSKDWSKQTGSVPDGGQSAGIRCKWDVTQLAFCLELVVFGRCTPVRSMAGWSGEAVGVARSAHLWVRAKA